MHTCEYCLADHGSWSAYLACVETCEIEDARQRAWVKSHPTGAVRKDTTPA
jgi:hypothetical protein